MKGSHEECCCVGTSAKTQLDTVVSVQNPACRFSLVHLGLAGTEGHENLLDSAISFL